MLFLPYVTPESSQETCFFSPNILTTPRRSSSVAIVQYSMSTDTYRYMHKQQIERRRPGSSGYERDVR